MPSTSTSPALPWALRETGRVLPAALTVAALFIAAPFLGLPSWSARAPFLVGRVVAGNLLLVVAAAALLGCANSGRGRPGRVAILVAAAASLGLLGAVPALEPVGTGLHQLAGRFAGVGVLLLGIVFPVLRGRAALRGGFAAAAAMLVGAVILAPAVRPDLVLVTVDTLRADRVNAPGRADLVPNLHRFSGNAVRFTRAWSTAPWTIPAMSSIFTGIHPTGHGARFCPDEDRAAPLSKWWFDAGRTRSPNPLFSAMTGRVETLPQALSRAGYATGGFSDWFFITSKTGFARGFDRFDYPGHDRDDLLVRKAAAWYRSARSSGIRPVFLFVHLFGPHQPYEPPRDLVPSGAVPPVALPPGCFDTWDAQLDGESLAQRVMRREEPLPPDVAAHIASLYDGEVRSLDRNLGELLSAVDERPFSAADTLFAVTADHGDFLGERNLLDHGHYVYEPVLRVPLLVRFPRSWRVAPRAFDGAVSSHDLYPTLLRAAGVTPRHPLTALDLRVALDGAASRTLVAENDRNDAMVRLFGGRFGHEFETVTDGRWKLIITDDRKLELFDLETDPGESVDRAVDEPRRVSELKARLGRFRRNEARYPSEGRTTVSPEEATRLRSLGYVQ